MKDIIFCRYLTPTEGGEACSLSKSSFIQQLETLKAIKNSSILLFPHFLVSFSSEELDVILQE